MSFKPANAANTILDTMRKAVALQQAGEIEKAQRLYKTVLKKNPASPDANHLLGVCYRQLGFPKRAVEFIGKAISLASDRAPYHANLARALSDLNEENHAAVLAAAERAVALDPRLAEAQSLRAVAMTKLDRETEAEEIFKQIIVDHPNYGDAYRNYGVLLRDQKKFHQAVEFFDQAIRLDGTNIDLWVQRARARLEILQYEQSEEELKLALEIFPNNGDLMHEMARLLFNTGNVIAATPYAQAAHENEPQNIERLSTLGVILQGSERFDEARKVFEKAIASIKDPSPMLHWNLSFSYLGLGDLQRGWALHTAANRRNIGNVLARKFDCPEWDGGDLSGKTILVWHDQGVGDAYRCATMLPDLIAVADRIIVELPQKLVEPFQYSFPEVFVRTAEFDGLTLRPTAHDYDCHICITDLAKFFRNSFDDFKRVKHPVFKANVERARELHGRIPNPAQRPIVGISWRSRNLLTVRAKNYMSAPEIAPLLRIPGITFLNLQYACTDREVAFLQQGVKADLVHFEDIDQMNNMTDAAALASCCDLIITVNTSVADIAGSYDIPCWSYGRELGGFLLGKESPPWFPRMTYTRKVQDVPAATLLPGFIERLTQWRETWSPDERLKRLGLIEPESGPQ